MEKGLLPSCPSRACPAASMTQQALELGAKEQSNCLEKAHAGLVGKEAAEKDRVEGNRKSLPSRIQQIPGAIEQEKAPWLGASRSRRRDCDPEAPADVDEVVNYVRAMSHGLARLEKLPV